MDKKTVRAIEAAVVAGGIVIIQINRLHKARKAKLQRINDLGWMMNTLKDVDQRIELGIAFDSIVKDIEF